MISLLIGSLRLSKKFSARPDHDVMVRTSALEGAANEYFSGKLIGKNVFELKITALV